MSARLFFGPDEDSPFYEGRIFGAVVDFAKAYADRCLFKQENGKISLLIKDVSTIAEAVRLLEGIAAYS